MNQNNDSQYCLGLDAPTNTIAMISPNMASEQDIVSHVILILKIKSENSKYSFFMGRCFFYKFYSLINLFLFLSL